MYPRRVDKMFYVKNLLGGAAACVKHSSSESTVKYRIMVDYCVYSSMWYHRI